MPHLGLIVFGGIDTMALLAVFSVLLWAAMRDGRDEREFRERLTRRSEQP